MNTYNLLPLDFDYERINNERWTELRNQGVITVHDIEGVKDHCGNLFPIHTKGAAVSYAKSVKKQFPEVKFGLFTGKTFGELELVQEF